MPEEGFSLETTKVELARIGERVAFDSLLMGFSLVMLSSLPFRSH